jgi:large subunit ribosomal protein L21e
MVQRTGGFRRKTRQKLKKHARTKGKIAIRHRLQQFAVGDRVELKAEPGVQHGMYHPRFHGSSGIILDTQGDCYKVSVYDGNSKKVVIAHPVHLRKSQ